MTMSATKLPARTGMSGTPDTRFDTHLAEIVRVDPISFQCDIQFLTKTGGRSAVQVGMSAAGKRHMSGTMPVEGDIAIVQWMRFMRRDSYPIIVGFIPNGFLSGLKFDPVQALGGDRSGLPEGLAAEIKNWDTTIRHRFRQLYQGEHFTSSHDGAELHLDRGVHLVNRSMGEFLLRDADEMAILRSLNSFTSLASGRYKRGLIERSAMLFDHDVVVIDGTGLVPEEYEEGVYPGEYPTATGDIRIYRGRDELINAGLIGEDGKPYNLLNKAVVFPYQILPDGRKQHIVTDHGGRSDTTTSSQYEIFVEDRMEMPHKSDGVVEITREVDGFDADKPRFFIERVYGTVVGNDPYTKRDRAKYGKVLRPVVFANLTDGVGSARPRMEVCPPKHFDSLAAAYLFRMRPPTRAARGEFGGDLMVAFDKDGAFYANVPASSSNNPLGAGMSGMVNLEGGLKMNIGANALGDSLDINCTGAVRIRPGSAGKDGTGFNLRIQSAVHLEALGRDFNGIALLMRAAGASYREVQGDDTHRVTGSRLDTVTGQIRQEASRKSVSVSNGYSLKSGKGADEVIIGTRRFAIVADVDGGGMLVDIAGLPGQVASQETISIGGKALEIVTGDYTADLFGGDYLVNTTTGDIKLSAGKNVEIDATLTAIVRGGAGVTIESQASATFSATGPLDITSQSSISVAAPQVTLGNSPVGGCAIGVPGPGGPHIDFITGIPIRGSTVVSCS